MTDIVFIEMKFKKENNLDHYFKQIKNKSLLSKQQEIELAKKIENGNKEAKEKFIEHNLRLVIHVAKRYANNGVPLSDLIQEGNIGLIEAVEKFDWRKGYKFSSFAVWYIRKFALRSVQNNSRTVRISISTQEIIIKINKATQNYLSNHDSYPSVKKLSKILDKPVSAIKRAQKARTPETSLDRSSKQKDQEVTLLKTLPNEDSPTPPNKAREMIQKDKLKRLMDSELNSREKEIVKMRYGLEDYSPSTLNEVGEAMDLSGERIRQIQKQAELKIKKGF
uniref:RpoD family RNA polymerase sigma factor n=1 Tax=uncultured organism TaxID=155900 RepID=M1QAW4_9ZZZZ|nr:RpoD family RNA polymerase sigma factor [uncultured organism]